MENYMVKLSFIYSDTVHVSAENKKDAIAKALEECHEEYEAFFDSDVTEEF